MGNNHTLQYGDVIKITLKKDAWALYVGDGEIVHFVLIGADAVLKKDKLSNVAGKSNYHVENKYDGSLQTREKRAIERSVDLWLKNGEKIKIKESEKIINQLRYDEETISWIGYLMDNLLYYLSYLQPQTSTDPNPGDLIEMPSGLYSHWGVYVGNGYIVHLLSEGYVWKDRLSEYVPDKNYKVNNKNDKEYKIRKVQDIIKDANAKAWKDHKYNLVNMNCEHFATQLRYHNSISDQVYFLGGLSVVAVAGAAVAAVSYFFSKYDYQ